MKGLYKIINDDKIAVKINLIEVKKFSLMLNQLPIELPVN